MDNWMKLDNAAKIYPPMLSKHWAIMFRLSVDLSEDVDIELLEQAQKKTLERIPSFSYRLKRGFFWYYLEKIEGAPPIEQDINNPLQRFNFRKNNYFLYRLLVYRGRIAIEIFHSLADGTGGLTFLLTLTSEYLHLKYGTDIEPGKYILNLNEQPDEEEYSDAFLKYADGKTIPLKEPYAYRIGGKATDFNKLLMVSGIVDTDQLKTVAKRYNATISQFASGLLLACVLEIQKKEEGLSPKRMAKISIPVNLRNFFPSKTLRNFSSYVNPGVYGKLGDYSLQELIDAIKNYMGLYVNEKQLRAKFSYNVSAEENPLIRIVPVFIKNPVLQANYILTGDMYYSTNFSNLGLITLPQAMVPYVKRIDFLLGKELFPRSVCGCISYNGKTIFNFTRNIQSSELERLFFSKLVAMGVNVYIESNGRE